MSGRLPFSKLTKGFSPERRHRTDETKKEVVGGDALARVAPGPDADPARACADAEGIPPAISKLEQRADAYISSLRSYI